MTRSYRRPPKGPLPDYEYRELRDKLVAEWMEEDEMSAVYIIQQAWTPKGQEFELTEIYGRSGPEFFQTLEAAEGELRAIAAEYDIETDGDTFDVPTTIHQDEYFYIETLWSSK